MLSPREPVHPAPISIEDHINGMLASGKISHRLFISYGAMNAIFQYMTERAVLLMQQTNKFMYFRGVERLQPRFTLSPRFHYMHFPELEIWARKIVCFDCTLWKAYEIDLPRSELSLQTCRIAQIGPRVYAF